MLEHGGGASAEVSAARPRGFLRKKFQPPALPDPCIEEARVTSRVLDADRWRICLVCAPAGYGKSVLLSQWFRMFQTHDDCVALWMSLDVHDGSAARFLQALCRCFSAIDERFAALERELSACGASADIESFAIDFVNLADSACDADRTYLLFFDAYEQASSDALDELLMFLNASMGDNMRFVVAGSYLGPHVDDLLFGTKVLEVTVEDLMLDRDRFVALCHALMPDVSLEECEEMFEGSGRWPQSLVFYSVARKRTTTRKDALDLSEAYARRFFENEVMGRVDEETQTFLVETSLLEELDPRLCDAVEGTSSSRTLLEGLLSRNCFIRYDADADVFQYEPLFRRFLLGLLLDQHGDRVDALAERASMWYAERNLREQRAKYLAIASDEYYVESSVEGSVGLHRPSDCQGLLQYFISQPASAFSSDPFLVWSLVWSCISSGLVEEARYWIRRARVIAPDLPARAYEFADAICLALEGDSAGSLSVIRRLLDEGASSMPRAFQCLLVHMEGENCERLGRVKEGRDLYLKAHSLAERENTSFYRLFDYYLLAQLYFNIGDFEEANVMARKVLASCRCGSSLQGGALSVLASVQIERHELDEAAKSLDCARRCVSPNTNLDMYVDVHVALARIERVKGNLIEAFEIASDLVQAVEGRHCPRNMSMRAYVIKAVLAVELNEQTALRSCMHVIDGFIGSSDVLKVIPCKFALARTLWAAGRRDECFELLDSLKAPIQECGSTYFLTQLTILQSSYRAECGEVERAMVELNRALELAMRGGYMSVFLEGRTCMQELLLKLVTGRKTSFAVRSYAKEALSLFKTKVEIEEGIAFSQGDVQGYYALTEREREVLDKPNAGMSRGEIAASFGISQNTVKSHLKNIYSKLGVHTRSEAYRVSERDQKPEG